MSGGLLAMSDQAMVGLRLRQGWSLRRIAYNNRSRYVGGLVRDSP